MKRILCIFLALVLSLTMLAACGGASGSTSSAPGSTSTVVSTPAEQSYHLRMQSSWTSGLLCQDMADEFARLCNEMSGGRLQIESLVGGTVVGANDVFDAVDTGVIDIAHTCAFNWIANIPSAPLFGSRPFGLNPDQYCMWLYYNGGLDMWAEMYKDYNFGYVGACGMNFSEDFAWTNKEIASLEDFKSLKFRTVGYWGQILSEMGASVMTVPGAEIYSNLNTGVLDAAEFSNPQADYGLGLYEVCKYVYVPGYHQPTSINELIVNKTVWDSLPADLQAIIQNAAKVVTLWGLSISAQEDLAALKKFEEYGTEIRHLPDNVVDEIEQIAKELYAKKCAEDPFFKKVYESQEAVRADYIKYWSFMDTNR